MMNERKPRIPACRDLVGRSIILVLFSACPRFGLAVEAKPCLLSLRPVGGLAVRLHVAAESGVRLIAGDEDAYTSPAPIELQIARLDGRAEWYQAGYSELTPSAVLARDSFMARGRITSGAGSVLEITDRWWAEPEEQLFGFKRTVAVVAAGPGDVAFNSRLRFIVPPERSIADYEVFVPGVWYRDNHGLKPTALAFHYTDRYIYIREDRLPLPLVVLRDPETQLALCLLHRNAYPATTMRDKGLKERVVDTGMQFGSLGVDNDPRPAATFVFPGTEGERTYIWGAKANAERKRTALRSHPVEPGVRHGYELAIRLAPATDFARTVRDSWRWAYGLYAPEILTVDTRKIYADSIDLLDRYWETSDDVPGFPFSVKVPSGEVYKRSYQMGFVGQQIPAAFFLIRHGLRMKNQALRAKGEAIVDFWASNSLTDFGMPRIWWDIAPWRRWRPCPTQIRSASDGMEGMLAAWRVMKQHGHDRPVWLDSCARFGDWLIETQNDDGSFFRAYDHDGAPVHRGRENTSHPVRFLCELFHATGAEKYRDCALRAGTYSWDHEHVTADYVGGTPDNPNVKDKEACLMALNAYMALLDVTGDEGWLEAARRAANFAETWQYCWHVPPLPGEPKRTFPEGRKTTGLSIIATGHSGCDTFMSYHSFAYYRLYLLSGDEHYLDFAKQLLHNTKQTLDWDGSLGYAHPALHIEAGTVAPIRGASVKVWLPWLTVSVLEPLAKFADVFGSMSIADIERLPDDRRQRLHRRFSLRRLSGSATRERNKGTERPAAADAESRR